jgi:Peptidase family S41
MGARTWPARMARGAVRAVVALMVLALAAAGLDFATYDAPAWRADFEHLKREMAQRYANLDWMVSHRGLDLKALDEETSSAIDNAHSRVLAMLALRRFVQRFNDPHLRLVAADRSTKTPQAAAASAPIRAAASCEEAGYEADDYAFRFPFRQLKGWTTVGGGHFPAGMAGDVGVLRIAAFGEDRYLGACLAAFRPGLTARELQLAVRAVLQKELAGAIEALKARGARRLLVDVSGNGGGTEWVTEAVALFTDRELARRPSRLVSPQCDRSPIWRGEAVCPVLAPEGEGLSLSGTGDWNGKLYILADARTGSASEDFVAWLGENGAAVVIGARTAGAGCGYVDGGGRIVLQAVPFDVMAPNCARFLNDGTNEIEGIAPHIKIAMDGADEARALALAAALSEK